MSETIHRFKRYIDKHGLIEHRDIILAACSGGPDSVALFHMLKEICGEYDLRLILAHLNHAEASSPFAADVSTSAKKVR